MFGRKGLSSICKFLSTQTAVLEGIQERAGELGFCGEVRIQQEVGGVQRSCGGGCSEVIMVFSPFDFEKLCLKGGLDGLVFLLSSHGQFLAVCQVT